MARVNIRTDLVSLGTTNMVVQQAGQYRLEGKLSIPSEAGGDPLPSQVVVTINQNGSPIYTGFAGARGFAVNMVCANQDVIAVVLSSAQSVDQPVNAVKGTMALALTQ